MYLNDYKTYTIQNFFRSAEVKREVCKIAIACASGSGSTGVSTFNTRTGDVVLTSSDITTALTYTPYNGTTNPNGYISSVPAQSFASLTGKPTTLSGYGITDGATITQLNLKANIASPALTGTPMAPTASVGTNTTQIATTEFVLANQGNVNIYNSNGSISGGTRTVSIGSASQLLFSGSSNSTIRATGGQSLFLGLHSASSSISLVENPGYPAVQIKGNVSIEPTTDPIGGTAIGTLTVSQLSDGASNNQFLTTDSTGLFELVSPLRGGVLTFTADGTTTSFDIPHTLTTVIAHNVTRNSDSEGNLFETNIVGPNIHVNFVAGAPSDGLVIIVNWIAFGS